MIGFKKKLAFGLRFFNLHPMEPISAIVGALAAGAVAALKDTAGQAVKDAYSGLVKLVKDRYGKEKRVVESVEFLEKDPADTDRQGVLAKAMTSVSVSPDKAVTDALEKLLTVLERHAPEAGAAVGVDIGVLRATALDMQSIQAPMQGTGVRITEANISGPATFKDIGTKPPPK